MSFNRPRPVPLMEASMRKLQTRLKPRLRPRFKGPSFNRLIPNILTMLGLCSGLTGMRFALEGRFGAAAVAILVSAAIDGLDGRIARLLKATSRFGAEFDSLADFLCFGVAPAFILYLWTLQTAGGFGFVPCLMFAVCMALRLARFHAAIAGDPPPAYTYNFFTGVPAPAGAGLVLFPLFTGLEAQAMGWDWLYAIVHAQAFCAVMLIGTALLLVSTIPVWNFKNFKMRSRTVLPTMLGIGLYAAVLVADPWAALALGGVIYLGMLPFSARSYRALKREAEVKAEPPAA
ncbi:MAG: phosphatidylcholine/phosphatidylserine synthase [Alphaproteobacteria bacterium]|nr:phosphatidylcholine/phosphatidylserine synthase [Alphaproteobacteria bacterium]